MPWVRLDDQFAEHPKVMSAGPLAIAMHVAGLCYASRNLTDGHIPHSVAKRLIDLDGLALMSGMAGRDVSWVDVISDLVEVGIWTETDGGYQIHDYLDYQPSRREVEEKRADLHAKRSAAGSKGAQTRWQTETDGTPGQGSNHGNPGGKPVASVRQSDDPDPVPVPVPEKTSSSASNGFTTFNAKRAVEAVRERQRKGLPVKSESGLAKTIQAAPEFVEESKRIYAHKECAHCRGSGFVEEYAPGAGIHKLVCAEAVHD